MTPSTPSPISFLARICALPRAVGFANESLLALKPENSAACYTLMPPCEHSRNLKRKRQHTAFSARLSMSYLDRREPTHAIE